LLQVDGCPGTVPAKAANPWLQVDGLPVIRLENQGFEVVLW